MSRRERMRRWLCCKCQVEEAYVPHEDEPLKIPRSNANGLIAVKRSGAIFGFIGDEGALVNECLRREMKEK
ncbi:hypothetical protein GIB67_012526 [Kingdonia uniflora]|uniref:Uncharacterized protein n=1 Tax=Kingdonia uniflora TaxID=39325 RepID=A0A7J7N651_9MAGN|nr:hypothetical protein GIB67_012526 [Kingdonia uniflora]